MSVVRTRTRSATLREGVCVCERGGKQTATRQSKLVKTDVQSAGHRRRLDPSLLPSSNFSLPSSPNPLPSSYDKPPTSHPTSNMPPLPTSHLPLPTSIIIRRTLPLPIPLPTSRFPSTYGSYTAGSGLYMFVIYTYMICKKHTLGIPNPATFSHPGGGERFENETKGSLAAPTGLLEPLPAAL